MSKKKKKPEKKGLTWLWIILGAIAFLIILYAISGNSSVLNNETEVANDEIESITISGIGNQRTINYPNQQVELILSGSDNLITVTKTTILTEMITSGIDNTINLCYSHSPKITDSGINNKINYENC